VDAAVARFVQTQLGNHQVRPHATTPHAKASVVHVLDAAGSGWVVKTHDRRMRWSREVSAYRRWTPSLGGHAPAFRAADAASQSLIVSQVPPGPRASLSKRDLHHQAGSVLRRLHDCVAAEPAPQFGPELADRTARVLDEHPSLLGQRDLSAVRAMLREIAELSEVTTVACHLDYTPRNWLVDSAGVLQVIDFAAARRQPWLRDLVKLQCNTWPRRPDTREAFFDGYGRTLSADEEALLRKLSVVWVVGSLVFASDHDYDILRHKAEVVLSDLVATR